jgi:formylmethanofuran dehydrogenase subunit E
MNENFQSLLDKAVRFHGHLCGGQVIGVRMAMAGLRELGIEDPKSREGRDLVIFIEIDRCATDAIISVTGRTPGRRAIKMMDYGKMAATFIDISSDRAVRISVKGDSNPKVDLIAQTSFPEKDEKQANIAALIEIDERDLFGIQKVAVKLNPQDLPGKPLSSVTCQRCGEAVKDMREVILSGRVLCKPCAQGNDYYTVLSDSLPASVQEESIALEG